MSGMGVYSAQRRPVVGVQRARPDRSRRHRVRADESGLQARPRERRSVLRACVRPPGRHHSAEHAHGLPASFPAMHIDAVMNGRTMVAPSDPTPHSPIHIDDMKWMLEPLLDAASTTACITNWCGDDVTTVQDWVRDAAAWSGRARPSRRRIRSRGVPRARQRTPRGADRSPAPAAPSSPTSFRTLFTELTGLPAAASPARDAAP